MSYTDAMIDRYGYCASAAAIRRVWAAVTQQPSATCRELAGAAGIGYRGVAAALRVLHDAGYIDSPPRLYRARRIIVPFVIVRSTR